MARLRHCPDCGLPLTKFGSPDVCPKCDADLIAAVARKPLVVDVAHQGETIHQALAKVDQAVSEFVWRRHPSLKVIHGGSGRIKAQVLHALQRHAARLGANLRPDGGNEGAHILSFPQ